MAATTTNIADDWQHVDDSDTFSVISLPASEDGPSSPSTCPNRPPNPAISSPSDSLVHPCQQSQSEGHAGNRSALRDTERESGKNKDRESYGCDLGDVVRPDLDKNQEFESRDVKPDTTTGQSNETVDFDINPNVLYEVTMSVVKLLLEVKRVLGYQPVESGGEIRAACQSLLSHLNCLQGILRGYAPHWRPGGRNADILIDPGLYEWLSKLKSELVNILAMLDRVGTCSSNGSYKPWASEAASSCKKLKLYSGQMDGLMTVMQSDYEEFHTLHMPAISTPAEASRTSNQSGHGRSDGCVPSGHQLFHLRRELYALKDQIVSCLDQVHASVQSGGSSYSSDHRMHLTALTQSYQHIKESLDLMLSNHASDWIDYSITGGLTYPEFCRLNTDTIRSLLIQLKEVTDDLFVQRSKQSLRYVNDPDDLLYDAKLAIPEPIIATLSTIEEVLVSILRIRRDVS